MINSKAMSGYEAIRSARSIPDRTMRQYMENRNKKRRLKQQDLKATMADIGGDRRARKRELAANLELVKEIRKDKQALMHRS